MSSLFLPQSSRHTGAIICMLQKILATSRRLEDSLWIASRDEKSRYPRPWKHWKSASTPRSAVEKDRQIDGLAVAQPALSCFPLRDVYGSRMVHHANTICWFVVSTHPDPSSSPKSRTTILLPWLLHGASAVPWDRCFADLCDLWDLCHGPTAAHELLRRRR